MTGTNENRITNLRVNEGRCKWQRLSNFVLAGCVLVCAVLSSGSAFGGRISDIRGTSHNLSAVNDGASTPSGGSVPNRTVKATTETQICVFCHTPHGATLGPMPLWNRKLSNAQYTVYTSSSLDANAIQGSLDQPGGSSKLCLSCHDGTLAIGSVNVLNGLGSAVQQQSITMDGTDPGDFMPASGAATGYTRNLGIDLRNDHPISVDYTLTLANRDGELRSVNGTTQKDTTTGGAIIGVLSQGYRPKAPLEPTGTGNVGQIQCATCHDPHIRETDQTMGNQKFLRLNRFQQASPTTVYNSVNDISCVACHDKNQGIEGAWIYSAHANDLVATQTYTDVAASKRQFPKPDDCIGCAALPVWKASCLNCHDTHSAQGSRWLLREGASAGQSAVEETCYQCHTSDASAAITLTNVPDIKSDYTMASGKHMPITFADQGIAEAHEIGGNFPSGGDLYGGNPPYEWEDCSTSNNKCGADFVEKRSKLGAGTDNLTNRHAECSDCHNPHRVVKFRTFAPPSLADSPHSGGTHGDATDVLSHDSSGYTHTNIASGVLRGTFGVEPIYSDASFANLPSGYDIKRGDPGVSPSTLVGASHVTREYQICLKCHSDYGFPDDNKPDASTMKRPALGGTNLTNSGTNNLTHYTNQAKELQAPTSHKATLLSGEPKKTDSGAGATYADGLTQVNYRSWHPVMDNTGRTADNASPNIRGVTATQVFNAPWSNNVGNQTMYCSDCHGAKVSSSTSVVPDGGEITGGTSWGPHGSSKNFILKGDWNSSSGSGGQTNDLCFKCHDYNSYATGSGYRTGFWTTDNGGADGHQLHYAKTGNKTRCNWCHVAVPHGWKNKALLVNLNDVGPEAVFGQATDTEVQILAASGIGYNAAPYYMNARLKVLKFKASGNWTANDCGSRGTAPGTGNGMVGKAWMSATLGPDTSENCATPP